MQGRMKQHQLSKAEIQDILSKSQVGRIATLSEDGYPYIVPVHFVSHNERIYIHGLIKGQKISNLKQDDRVGFEVDEMGDLIFDQDNVCDTNTAFRSVIILGRAHMIEEDQFKRDILRLIVSKYTPQFSRQDFPDKIMQATGIIEIQIEACTGKYYK